MRIEIVMITEESRIFSRGSSMVDSNPVLEEGNPLSSGGIRAAATLFHILGITFNLELAQRSYSRGWGNKALDAKPTLCSWTLSLLDINEEPTDIVFDLFDDNSPLAVGLDDKNFSETDLLSKPPVLTLALPPDDGIRVLPIYI